MKCSYCFNAANVIPRKLLGTVRSGHLFWQCLRRDTINLLFAAVHGVFCAHQEGSTQFNTSNNWCLRQNSPSSVKALYSTIVGLKYLLISEKGLSRMTTWHWKTCTSAGVYSVMWKSYKKARWIKVVFIEFKNPWKVGRMEDLKEVHIFFSEQSHICIH